VKTLYLRNVPDDVIERLARLAARDGTSVSAVAVRSSPRFRAASTMPRCSVSCPTVRSTFQPCLTIWMRAGLIVVDASAALAGLLGAGAAGAAMGVQQVHVPHLVDSEFENVLRRKVRADELPVADGWRILRTWSRLGVVRHPASGLLDRIWVLRDNVSATTRRMSPWPNAWVAASSRRRQACSRTGCDLSGHRRAALTSRRWLEAP